VEYGDLLKHTKIPYHRTKELFNLIQTKSWRTSSYLWFSVRDSINSRQHPKIFRSLPFKLDETKLLFGKDKSGQNVIGKRGEVLKGLSRGGVYRKHQEYAKKIHREKFAFQF
jgi:hypothetical protein